MEDRWKLSDKQFNLIASLIKKVSGIILPDDKRMMLESRLNKRLVELSLPSFDAYFYVLDRFCDSEIPYLINLCTTHTTSFFREEEHFNFLESTELTRLYKEQTLSRRHLNIWCAACSTGEEAYSLALVIHQFCLDKGIFPDFTIYASDIDVHSIQKAREGVFHKDFAKDIPIRYHDHMIWDEKRESFRFHENINQRIKWSTQNLFYPFNFPPGSTFDYVFVRNVFIYFNPEEINDCVGRIRGLMEPQGLLFMGLSEHLSKSNKDFKLWKNAIYTIPDHRTVEKQQVVHRVQASAPSDDEKDVLKVMMVDDSKTMHKIMTHIFSKYENMELVRKCFNGEEALRALDNGENVDVVLTDIQMPVMDGLEFLHRQMKTHRVPTIIVSAFSREDGRYYFDAMDRGAVDYIEKPHSANLTQTSEELGVKIAAAQKALSLFSNRPRKIISQVLDVPFDEPQKQIVLIGSSTGGPQALEHILTNMPGNMPPVVISQHMPASFVDFFCDRLDQLVALEVQVAEQGIELRPGNVYLAPGDKHIALIRKPSGLSIEYNDSPQYKGQPTSVDSLFRSAQDLLKRYHVVAALLTGMGKDGAYGMQALHEQGVYTIVQDQESSIVWGMAGTAYNIGAASKKLPLDQIAGEIIHRLKKKLD